MRLRLAIIGFVAMCTYWLLACAGCASKPSRQEITLTYVRAGTGLLNDLKPVLVSLLVVDRRLDAQRQGIGVQRNTLFGSKRATVVSGVPEVRIIHDAMQAELERSGHRVLDPGTADAGMAVTIALTEFLVDSQATSDMDVELVGSIRADVTASAGTQDRNQVSLTVDSTYRHLIQAGWIRPLFFGSWGLFSRGNATGKDSLETAMNGTLAEFVRRFCLEPKLRQVFVETASARELSTSGPGTYARQPAGIARPVAADESSSPERREEDRDLTEVQESGWIESMSIAPGSPTPGPASEQSAGVPRNVGTANILHGTRKYLLQFRPDCVVRISEDPLIAEIAADKLLRFFQGEQHQFVVQGHVGTATVTLASAETVPVLEVSRLERLSAMRDDQDR